MYTKRVKGEVGKNTIFIVDSYVVTDVLDYCDEIHLSLEKCHDQNDIKIVLNLILQAR